MNGWTISVMILAAVLFATGFLKTRKEIRRAKMSRWATWLDEPWNNDANDE